MFGQKNQVDPLETLEPFSSVDEEARSLVGAPGFYNTTDAGVVSGDAKAAVAPATKEDSRNAAGNSLIQNANVAPIALSIRFAQAALQLAEQRLRWYANAETHFVANPTGSAVHNDSKAHQDKARALAVLNGPHLRAALDALDPLIQSIGEEL